MAFTSRYYYRNARPANRVTKQLKPQGREEDTTELKKARLDDVFEVACGAGDFLAEVNVGGSGEDAVHVCRTGVLFHPY